MYRWLKPKGATERLTYAYSPNATFTNRWESDNQTDFREPDNRKVGFKKAIHDGNDKSPCSYWKA